MKMVFICGVAAMMRRGMVARVRGRLHGSRRVTSIAKCA